MATTITPRYRWLVFSRIMAALIPAFLLINTLGVALTLLLPVAQHSAIAWVTLFSFAGYCALVMWIFHAKSLRLIWSSLVIVIAVTSGLSWWFIQMGNAQ
ncbi:MAG: hypothetical protein AAGJ37_03230 [Pseudomonadota bacterium]